MYQSNLWKYISEKIYNKPIFEIEFFWKKYWGIKKEHNRFWLNFSWYQVLGIELPDNYEKTFKQELNFLRKQFLKFWNVFFQLWITNKLSEPFYEKRLDLETNFKLDFWLFSSIKENMPLATIEIDLKKDDFLRDFSKTAKRYVNKAKKDWLNFLIADDKQVDGFYKLWKEVADFKWFHIYDYSTYKKLIDFLKSTKQWDLFILEKDWEIYSWNIWLFDTDKTYYLYWAGSRDVKYSSDYYLKLNIFEYLKNKWYKTADLLWISPDWYKNHHLKWVTQSKKSFWWEHIEYYWNFDLPLNKILYKGISLLRK